MVRSSAATSPRFGVGHEVGPYKLVREIGRGAMATVYEATRAEGKPVAVKILLPEIAALPEIRERFEREGRILQALRHENVARVYEVGSLPDGSLYLAIELLEGSDLGSVLADVGLLSVGVAVRYIFGAALGVAEAHALGVVHRDLKPGNIFLAKNRRGEDVPKVLDFGVAKVLGAAETAERGREVIGSPHYMAPEQLLGSTAVTPRSDVWALGVVLYKALADMYPFDASSIPELCRKIREDSAYPLGDARPDVPAGLADVVRRCLAKDPAARYAHAGELADALQPYLPEEDEEVTRITEESTRFMPAAREMQQQSAMKSLAGMTAAPEAPMSMSGMLTASPMTASIVSSIVPIAPVSSTSVSIATHASGAFSAVSRISVIAPPPASPLGTGKDPRLPWLIAGGAAAALLFVVGVILIVLSGSSRAGSSVKVHVTSQPDGAFFTIDYGAQMTAPRDVSLRRDERAHIITVWKDGFRPETRELTLTSDVVVDVKLVPAR